MAKKSPTQNSLDALRKEYSTVQVVEHWCPFSRRRKDLFGFVDILAVGNGETVAVQTTSWANVSARVKKITESDALPDLRKAGWTLRVHGWRKNKTTGKFECKTVDLS